MNMTTHDSSPCTDIPYTDVVNHMLQTGTAPISIEVSTPLFLNGKRICTLQSSPHDMASLAVGYCLAEHHIPAGQEISCIKRQAGCIYLTTGEMTIPRPVPPQDNVVTAAALYRYGNILDTLSAAHQQTHGVHEGALLRDDIVLAYAEDIGRHNVLDRLRGTACLRHLDVSRAVLIFSGRVPQSVITKVHELGVAVIAARAMPTSLAIRQADSCGITLICGLRTDRFRIFTHKERIIL
ncbi:MAG: formate dehydrogenase accessory sulfurtransferase FdhD [Megasphaera sp.]|nr:formate dehydrogenase accessory sulfurtransferase FdhD [Megasphaera sp.]